MRNRGYIENEAAYEAAIARNIRNNARKTARDKWMKIEGAERANAFLFRYDEFEDHFCPHTGNFLGMHPVVQVSLGDFYRSMVDNVNEWGGLTEKQTKAVLDMIERGEKRVAERAKARAEAAARDAETSGWIGRIGERIELRVKVRSVFENEGQYGISYFHILNDEAGNVIVYGGTKRLGDLGEWVSIKATIKDHDERQGVKQTKITRPAKL